MNPRVLPQRVMTAMVLAAALAGCVAAPSTSPSIRCGGAGPVPMLFVAGGPAPIPIPGNGSRETVLGPDQFQVGNGSSEVELSGAPVPCQSLVLTGEFAGFRDHGRRLVVLAGTPSFDALVLGTIIHFDPWDATNAPPGTYHITPSALDNMTVNDQPMDSYVSQPGSDVLVTLRPPDSNTTVTFLLANWGMVQTKWTNGGK